VWQASDRERTFISLVSILFDWPLLAFLAVLVGGYTFRSNVAALIDRIKQIRTPWGTMDTSPVLEPPAGGEAPEPPQEYAVVPAAQAGNAAELQVSLEFANNQWFFWWAEFLFMALIPETKAILVWYDFNFTTPTSKDFYHHVWDAKLPAAQVEGILNVLWNFEVVVRDPNALVISPLGKRLVAHFDQHHSGWRIAFATFFPPSPTPGA
jgi:hypothetical protein